jgi:integrase
MSPIVTDAGGQSWTRDFDTPLLPKGGPQVAKKLTPISIEKIKPETNKRREIPDGGKCGLYLVVQPSGKKSWAVRYRRLSDGRPRKFTLDGFPSLGLARKLAQQALDSAAEGGDPAAQKKLVRKSRGIDCFGEVTERFLERGKTPNGRPWRESYAREIKRLLRKEVMPIWGERRIQDITKQDVRDLLDRFDGVSANRVLAAVRRVFNWAVEIDILAASPTTKVKAPHSERSRDRVLSDHEIGQFWHACCVVGYPFGDLAKLLLLTGQRRTEVAGMRWSEIDFEKREWHIPATRTKNAQPHLVPLSVPALELINSMPRIGGEYVLTTTGRTHVSGYSNGKKAIDAQMRDVAHWSLHDLRRTAASGMARLGVALPVIEKVLNHISGSFAGIVGVYQRHHFSDEKRKALETWGAFVLDLVSRRQASAVPMRA